MDQRKYMLGDEELENAVGGLLVEEGDGKRYWLVRQDGSVIAPIPIENGREFAQAYGVSERIVTREEYRSMFGRELRW